MKFLSLVSSFKKCEDCLVSETGVEVIDVLKMIAENAAPPSPPCLLITVKHWFFFERRYLINPIMWMTTGAAIRLPKEGNMVKRTEAFVRPDNSRFYLKLNQFIHDHSVKMINEINEKNTENLPAAQIINLADRRKK